MTKKKTQPETEERSAEQTPVDAAPTADTNEPKPEGEAAAPQPEQPEAAGKALEEAQRQRDEYIALAQRVQADFDNYRRRNQNARQDAYDDGVRDTLTKLLPVLDNLERACAAQGSEDAIREGVQMVLKQTLAMLSAAGVEEITADGVAFDPNLHNAVMQEPADGVESGTVLQVLQKGYAQGTRVLRHSMVKVAQ